MQMSKEKGDIQKPFLDKLDMTKPDDKGLLESKLHNM